MGKVSPSVWRAEEEERGHFSWSRVGGGASSTGIICQLSGILCHQLYSRRADVLKNGLRTAFAWGSWPPWLLEIWSTGFPQNPCPEMSLAYSKQKLDHGLFNSQDVIRLYQPREHAASPSCCHPSPLTIEGRRQCVCPWLTSCHHAPFMALWAQQPDPLLPWDKVFLRLPCKETAFRKLTCLKTVPRGPPWIALVLARHSNVQRIEVM